MKSLFGKPDSDKFSKQLVGVNNQKYCENNRLDKIKQLLKEKDNCTLHSIELVSSRSEVFVRFTKNKSHLFRNYHKKTNEELVTEIYEEMCTRHLMGDFDA